jgi:hypothetical protein
VSDFRSSGVNRRGRLFLGLGTSYLGSGREEAARLQEQGICHSGGRPGQCKVEAMTVTQDHRRAAEDRIQELIAIIGQQPASDTRTALIEECEALARAVAAFHLEAIRFRSYNVDRLLRRPDLDVPPSAGEAFAEMRKSLEAAGFHTRSHQAPST